MKSLISINNKFMSLSPKYLIELISNSRYTKGIELYVEVDKKEEMKYLEDLVFEIKRNNLILQIHGIIELELDKQIEYMKLLENYSDYLGYPIVVTFHTIYYENKNESLSKTIDYLSEIIKNVDNEKIIICLENLNDKKGFYRTDKDDVKETILNNESLYFTYDIGHEISNHGKITDIDKYLLDDIRNVHIHSINTQGIDHIPIYKNDIHWNEIMKGIEFLINNKYKYNIVYEYGLEFCYGDTVEDKINDYLNSIDMISEKYNN